MGELTLADIADLRAYEREREAFRAEVIELKKLRRVPIGPLVTVVFESRTTILFQVQEMARAERMVRDEQIQTELDIYNPLIPRPGDISMTLFIELTTEAQLREWLPKLVGVERSVYLAVGEGAAEPGDQPAERGASGTSRIVIAASVDPAHEAQLTRDSVTASVHYVRIAVPEGVRDRLAGEPVAIGIDHPEYQHNTLLPAATVSSLVGDWST
jgi:hypothetical protein